MFELFGEKTSDGPRKQRSRKRYVCDDPENCRVVTDLFDSDGDAFDSWRVFRIMSEFVQGFELLRRYGLAATVFGGARFTPDDPYYKHAEELSAKLATMGFAIITGGGPGIMEGANVGAHNAGGRSLGLNIALPQEQKLNPYVAETAKFDFFFSRKVMLAYASEVYIFFPGGFGTLDEFFEIVTLVQTQKIEPIPVMLYGREFWEPLLEWMKTSLLKQYKTISPEDLELFHVVDSTDEAIVYIEKRMKGKLKKV